MINNNINAGTNRIGTQDEFSIMQGFSSQQDGFSMMRSQDLMNNESSL